jgi:hypothetical protein
MNSFTAHGFAVPHSPIRLTIGVVVMLIMAGNALNHFFSSGLFPPGFDMIINGLAFLGFGCWAVGLFVQLVRRIPILEASSDGISNYRCSGNLFIPWRSIEAITSARNKSMRIQLRQGTRLEASIFVRLASASLWQRRTVAISLLTAVPSADSIVENLRRIQSAAVHESA